VSGARWPSRYEIRVESVLDSRWSEWFDGLQIESEGAETVLSGRLSDHSALHGVLDKLQHLGLTIIALRRLPPDEQHSAGT
jgi:hypothetical protein